MKFLGKYCDKNFYEGSVSELTGFKEPFLVLLSSNTKINESKFKKVIEKNLMTWFVFGADAEILNYKLDGWAREINCDNVPKWFWAKDFKAAIDEAVLRREKDVLIVAPTALAKKIRKTLDPSSNNGR